MGIAEKLAIAEQVQGDTSIYHVFDIETGYATGEEVAAQVAAWTAPANIKDEEKITERRAAFEADAKSKSALTDAAPIICLSFETGNNDEDKAVFSCMPEIELQDALIAGFELHQFPTEKAMLLAYTDYVQGEYIQSERFTLAGHNILGFDLPKIRNRMIRNGLQIPPVFLPYAQNVSVYDTMKKAADFGCDLNKRARENGGFVSFDLLALSLGMDSHKSIMTGAEIPANHEKALELIAEGKLEEAKSLILATLVYSALDAQKEARAFRLMTGKY
ncbi:hypothetical protein [Thiothrix sp.]|jgi:hypothetical protein|uniref:hypothetical protein n=1 Tax=Thiothrix sp. TaxID=1032 RepID=UPI00257E5E86|nr:hypothetical protein [Thiothrix sp.]